MSMHQRGVCLGYIALICTTLLAHTSPAAAFDAPTRIQQSLSLSAGCGLIAFVHDTGGGLASARVRPLATGATQTQAAGGASFFNGTVSTTFSAITTTNLETNCSLADVTNLVQQGAAGGYGAETYIGVTFEATRTSDGDRYSYRAEISGAAATTVTVSQTLLNAAPTVTLGSLSGPDGSGNYTVIATLSENSTDFTAASLTLTNATATVSGSGSSYTIVLTPVADGSVGVIVPKGAFTDSQGLVNWAASNKVAFEADVTAPSVSISTSATSVTGPETVSISVTFSENVTGFETSDFTVANGTVTQLQGSKANYVATVAATGRGDLEISIPAGAATDPSGNTNTASNTLSITNAIVEKTQKVIAQFMHTRATQLISSQPDLTGFLSGGAGGSFDFVMTSLNGEFDFASQPGAENGVWMRFNGSWSRENTARSHYLFGAIGHHFKISPTFLIGGMVEFDYLSQTDEKAQINGYGWLAGPYAVARLPEQPLFFEGRFLYGQTSNDISPLGTYTDSFDTQRILAQLKVSGEVGVERTIVVPSLKLSYTSDDQDQYVDDLGNFIPEQGIDLLQGELGLDFRHQVNLPMDSATLELMGGVSLIGSSTNGSGNTALVVPEFEGSRAKIKMGANYIMPNGGDFVLETHYDGIGVQDYESYGLQLGFKLAF
ncbi:MAG: Ig-like domain-containing protein [Roseibium sp.]